MFADLLKRAQYSKMGLAREFHLHKSTIYGWKDDPPHYVIVFLLKIIEHNEYKQKVMNVGLQLCDSSK